MSDQKDMRVSRRTIAKGVAWSVPAAAAFAAAPAYAASPGCIPSITFGPGSCKCPGQSTVNPFGYFVRLCNTGTVCPDGDGFIWVTIRANTGQNPKLAGPFQVPVNGCTDLLQFTSTNSANFLRLYYADTAAGADLTTSPFITVASPPDCVEGGTDLGDCNTTTTSTTAGTTTSTTTATALRTSTTTSTTEVESTTTTTTTEAESTTTTTTTEAESTTTTTTTG